MAAGKSHLVSAYLAVPIDFGLVYATIVLRCRECFHPKSSIKCQALVAQWKSSDLLSRRSGVRIPLRVLVAEMQPYQVLNKAHKNKTKWLML